MAGLLACRLAGSLACWLAGSLDCWIVGWLACWLAGLVAGPLAGWLSAPADDDNDDDDDDEYDDNDDDNDDNDGNDDNDADDADDGNGNGISWRSLSHNQAFILKKNKLPNHFAVRTSECSWRATVAPAGWTSSGLRAPHTGGWAGGPMAPVVATG